jgi:thiol-disulfide isomerase/thioredoxin
MTFIGHKLLIGVSVIAMLYSTSGCSDVVAQTLSKVSIVVDGMMKSKSGATWMSWPDSVEAALLELAGVKSVEVDLATDKFIVIYDAATAHSDEMRESIVALGYRPSIVSSDANLDTYARSDEIPEMISTALSEAGDSGRLVFIDFHAPWCGACRKLEETTLSDPDVKAVLSHYVVLKVDTDEHPSVGKYFNVVGLPTLLVMSPTGEELYRHAGPIEHEPLANDLGGLGLHWWSLCPLLAVRVDLQFC